MYIKSKQRRKSVALKEVIEIHWLVHLFVFSKIY